MNFDVPPSPQRRQGKTALLVAASFLILVGLAGLAQLAEALTTSSWTWKEPDTDWFPWVMNPVLLALFGLQHSGMAREAWKGRFPETLQRAVYVFASGIACFALAELWQRVPGESWWRMPFWVIAFPIAAIAGMIWCLLRMDLPEFLGLRPFLAKQDAEQRLDTAGPYRFVRHPLMFFTLVYLWTIPEMTATHGMLVVGLTAYVLLGILLEERDLERRFGDAYVAYRRKTPMLVPWRFGF